MRISIRILVLLSCVTAILIIAGCRKEERILTADGLRSLVQRAIQGDSLANDSLFGFCDRSLPVLASYNNLLIDSITTPQGKKFYTMLFECENPIYNRFGIYDSTGKLALLDKSLNGYLTEDNSLAVFSLSDKKKYNLITITEKFLSIDSIQIERLNIYLIRSDSVFRVARTYKLFQDKQYFINNFISGIGTRSILYTLRSSDPNLNNQGINLLFDTLTERYIPAFTLLDDVVDSVVRTHAYQEGAKLIFNNESAELSVQKAAPPPATNVGQGSQSSALKIDIPNNWHTQKGISIAAPFKKATTGDLFSNENIGAKISVIEIAVSEATEDYSDEVLTMLDQPAFSLRASGWIQKGFRSVQLIEAASASRKYLIAVDVPIKTFANNETLYQNIIRSIKIEG